MPDTNALTDDERAELEALRAEKAKREQAQAAAAERAELEALSADDHRSAYYENKIAWCKLLLEHAEDEPFRAETSQR